MLLFCAGFITCFVSCSVLALVFDPGKKEHYLKAASVLIATEENGIFVGYSVNEDSLMTKSWRLGLSGYDVECKTRYSATSYSTSRIFVSDEDCQRIKKNQGPYKGLTDEFFDRHFKEYALQKKNPHVILPDPLNTRWNGIE